MTHTRHLPTLLFLAQCASTLFMLGLIWFVQIVHYPLFSNVGTGESLRLYATRHANRTGYVVILPMLVEFGCSLAALFAPLRPSFVSQSAAIVLALLVLFLWLTTGLLQVPLHDALGKPSAPASEQPTILRLVATNWIRTAAWTLRAALLLYLLAHALPPRA